MNFFADQPSDGHHFGDGGAVRDHANRTHDLCQVTAWNDRRRLVVDAALEAGRAPINELDRALRLDRRHGGVHVLRHDVTPVHHAARLTRGHTRHVCRYDSGTTENDALMEPSEQQESTWRQGNTNTNLPSRPRPVHARLLTMYLPWRGSHLCATHGRTPEKGTKREAMGSDVIRGVAGKTSA